MADAPETAAAPAAEPTEPAAPAPAEEPAAPAAEAVHDPALVARVLRQVVRASRTRARVVAPPHAAAQEFYFSNSNFPRDRFLRGEAEKDPQGCACRARPWRRA